MEVVRSGRETTIHVSSEMRNRGKLVISGDNNDVHEHPGRRSMKIFSKVQVVYYLTRNGQLEHPHFLEVSHLATQPLRLRDVMERLTVLRGNAMAGQYSWSCKRSYKNGYVWNDLSENDIVYASEGSEYVLKGSELIPHTHFSEMRARELELKDRKLVRINQVNSKAEGYIISTSTGHNLRQPTAANKNNNNSSEVRTGKHLNQNNNDVEEDINEEDEDKGSCNSSNPPYPPQATVDECPLIMQIDQEETYSLPSTSSTNSDKPPPLPPPPPPPATPYLIPSKKVNTGDGPRNTVLMQLIACGGGSMTAKSKLKPIHPKVNAKNTDNNNSFNFNLKLNAMRSSIMPCLKQQLSTKGAIRNVSYKTEDDDDDDDVDDKEEVDEDMMMVRYISENPRFGNLQSQEKEYFSGTIVETMTTHHRHTPSSGSVSAVDHQHSFPVFTKSSSYNEQRSFKSGLQAAAEEEKEKDGVKVKGIIKCIPRRKSCGYNSSKSSKI